jgi:capsular polysaccharide biosynthesis protein
MDDDTDAAPAPAGDDLLGYLRTLRAGWWLVLAVTAVGLLAGLAVAWLSPTTYESASSVLVLPTGVQDTNATGGRTHGTVNLDTEAQLVTSTAVAGRARTLLHSPTQATRLAGNVSVSVPPNSTVLTITYAAPTATAAQAGAHAFAAAYLANRAASATSAAADQATALRAQIQQVTAALQQLSGGLAGLPAGSAQRVYLDSQRANLSNQLNDLTGRLNTLTTTDITAGRIISDAPRPSSAASPSPPVDGAAGLGAGLLLGIAAALLYGRLNRTVHRAADLPRRTGLRVLATLTDPTSPARDDAFAPHTPAGRLFARLRNELTPVPITTPGTAAGPGTTAAADATGGNGSTGENLAGGRGEAGAAAEGYPAVAGRVIAVVGTSDGWTATVVAVNLAAAINRAAGDRPAERAVVFADCADPTGDIPAEARESLATLRTTAAHILVVTPDAAVGPDAQTLAGLSDAAILTVELRHSRYAAVADAAQQIRRVGTPVLGAVVLPRLIPHPIEPTPTAEPTQPAAPAEDTEPDQTPEPAEDTGPDQAAEPAEITEAVEDTAPDQTAEPAETAEAAEDTAPDQTAGPETEVAGAVPAGSRGD